MRKIYSCFLLTTLIVCGLFFACSKKDSTTPASTTTTTSATTGATSSTSTTTTSSTTSATTTGSTTSTTGSTSTTSTSSTTGSTSGTTSGTTTGKVTAPCTPKQNTVTPDMGMPTLTFYSEGGRDESGTYMVTGNGPDGDLNIRFHGDSAPVTGIYTVDASEVSFQNDKVDLWFVTQNFAWSAYAYQKVYVNVDANTKKVSITFCSLKFGNSNFGSTAVTASGNIVFQP